MLPRADFTRERLDQIAAESGAVVASDAELEASRAFVLRAREAGDLWVFAYGSLMWNPAITVSDTRPARLEGWHRSFCLHLPGGRGTPDRPGLMCALVASGRCEGLALRIAADDVERETQTLWLREMAFGGYRAALLPLDLDGASVRGLIFTAEPSRTLRLPLDEQARRIALAEGALGSNRDYLFRLEQNLEDFGLSDDYVSTLTSKVRTIRNAFGRSVPQ